MRTTRLRHALAVATAAAVLATMSAATVASPAAAAKPKCQGKTATIVGTRKSERIVGTARRDVIVAKGGNDKIYGRGGNDLICAGAGHDLVVGGPGADTLWGQLGNDRLHGGPGNDFIAGQVGNDTLNGGLNFDKCFQGTGSGPRVNCELPPPPPPPDPPTLVIAYSDVNTNHVFDAGDVLIAKIMDSAAPFGSINPGDQIKMGQYPTSGNVIKPAQLRSQFDPWKVTIHTVNSGDLDVDADGVEVMDTAGNYYYWTRISAVEEYDWFAEEDAAMTYESEVWDDKDPNDDDGVETELSSPSQPSSAIYQYGYGGIGDDGVIDVEFAPGV